MELAARVLMASFLLVGLICVLAIAAILGHEAPVWLTELGLQLTPDVG